MTSFGASENEPCARAWLISARIGAVSRSSGEASRTLRTWLPPPRSSFFGSFSFVPNRKQSVTGWGLLLAPAVLALILAMRVESIPLE